MQNKKHKIIPFQSVFFFVEKPFQNLLTKLFVTLVDFGRGNHQNKEWKNRNRKKLLIDYWL